MLDILFKKLNSTMRIYESNIRLLHWNTVGEEFNDAHKEITEPYYEMIAKDIDRVSEIMGMINIFPPNYLEVYAIVKKYNENYVVVDSGKLYNRREISEKIGAMFGDITDIISEILDSDDLQSTKQAAIKSELESIMFDFDFQRRYINKRRLLK